MNNVLEKIKQEKIIAIIRGVESRHILNVMDALYSGGIRIAEITFNHVTDKQGVDTTQSIALAAEKYAGRMCIGAGTVITTEEVEKTKKAGGTFIISPNVNVEIIQKTKALQMVSMPGAMTPSEAEIAWKNGCDVVKIFPAGELGAGYIKSLKASLNHISYFAVGGIREDNLKDYFAAGADGFGIGANLVDSRLVEAGDFKEIERRAKAFRKALERITA